MMPSYEYTSRHETEEEAAIRVQANAEREAAYAAVSKAMASYRWWGFTALLAGFRIWLTQVKFRLGMKLWP